MLSIRVVIAAGAALLLSTICGYVRSNHRMHCVYSIGKCAIMRALFVFHKVEL